MNRTEDWTVDELRMLIKLLRKLISKQEVTWPVSQLLEFLKAQIGEHE